MMTRERDRYKDEAESARQKNRDNLQQTQEGIKAFKDQVSHRFRIMKRDDYFWVDFNHFWIEQYFL